MAASVLVQRFQSRLAQWSRLSWQALARLIPHLEQAGLHFFYRIDPKLAFPAREIQSMRLKNQQVELNLNFMGLQGASTPLPIHYSELIIQDDPEESNLNEFYNFFNQQFFRHLLAIQHKYAYLPQAQEDQQDPLTLQLLSFAGLHPDLFAHPQDYAGLIPFAPVLLGRQLSQSAWCQLIQSYFQCDRVWLQQWVPLKMRIPDSAQNRLGANIFLGRTGSLGAFVTQAKTHAAVHLSILQVEGFLPHQTQYQALRRLLQWLTPTPLQFTVVLHVQQGNALHLHRNLGVYLGWNALLSRQIQPEMQIVLR